MRLHRLAALKRAPAVVSTARDEVHHLPHFPAHIAAPEISLAIETHLPGIPQSIRPKFRTYRVRQFRLDPGPLLPVCCLPLRVACRLSPVSCPLLRKSDPWVIRRHPVVLSRVALINVDPQNGPSEVADVLSRLRRVGRRSWAAVARRDIKVTLRAEMKAATVVTARKPRQNDLFARRISTQRLERGELETRNS